VTHHHQRLCYAFVWQRFMVVVTGDHSTPVLFGDHSLEPVPFAVAHVAHVVRFCCIVYLAVCQRLQPGMRAAGTIPGIICLTSCHILSIAARQLGSQGCISSGVVEGVVSMLSCDG
jgi:hypothetical protein